jgi:nucleoside 2-deoxyribosyltransferase
MKVYFGFTVAGDRSSLEAARLMVKWLEDLGHEVLTRHLVGAEARAADRLLGAEAVYRRDMAWLQKCDLFIAEVSGSSFGVGFEAGYLLGSTFKKAILFYDRALAERMSLLITGNTHPNCTVIAYSSAWEIKGYLEHHIGRETHARDALA